VKVTTIKAVEALLFRLPFDFAVNHSNRENMNISFKKIISSHLILAIILFCSMSDARASVKVTPVAISNQLTGKVSETDQAGKTTEYEYDELGRLIAVTDALGSETRYAYDEVGNKIEQTDPNGNLTIWDYDNQGHVIAQHKKGDVKKGT
jgi:YD repeat-containing protein